MALVYIGKYAAKILQAKRKAVEAKKAIINLANSAVVQETHVKKLMQKFTRSQ